HRPSRIARQNVDLARLEGSETLLRSKRRELDLCGIIEDRRRNCTAEIDIHPGPVILLIRSCETDESRIGAALQEALRLDVVERSGRGHRRRKKPGSEADCKCYQF